MSEPDYDKAVFDTSFIANLNRVDSARTGLFCLISGYYAKKCIIDYKEYNRMQGTSQVQHGCENSKDFIKDKTKELKEFLVKNATLFKRTFKTRRLNQTAVHVDVVLLFLATESQKESERPVILSCDGGLLKTSYKMGVDHFCLKASLVDFEAYMGFGCILGNEEWNTEGMFDKKCKEWFFCFDDDSQCQNCKSSVCTFQNARVKYRQNLENNDKKNWVCQV